MRIDKQSVILFAAALVIVVAFQLLIQKKQDPDIVFCRNLYAQLAQGAPEVAGYIDWEHFRALEYDVGAEYGKIVGPKEKFSYKDTFIKGFAIGFKYFNGQRVAFTNWRIYSKSRDNVVVACDHPGVNKTLLFTFSKNGTKRKLVAVEWKQ